MKVLRIIQVTITRKTSQNSAYFHAQHRCFTAAKDDRAISDKRKGTRAAVQRKPGTSFRSSSEVAVVSDSVVPLTAAYQAPPSMQFSRQEYWSGVPLPSLVYHTNDEISEKEIKEVIKKNKIFRNKFVQGGEGSVH